MLYRRFVAYLLCKFGGLESFRENALAAGDANWRIIRYQRITNPESEPLPVPMSVYTRPETLEKHFRYLNRNCNVVSLEQLIELLQNQSPIPKNTVVITFDGGWIDNYTNALPIFKMFSFPISMFLPTQFIGTMNWLWPEKVLFAMLRMAERGDKVPLFSFFEKDIHFMAALGKLSPTHEINALTISLVIESLKRVSAEERVAALGVFLTVLNLQGGVPEIRYFMNWDEVNELSKYDVSFGSLGHTHNNITDLDTKDVAIDLRESFQALRKRGLKPSNVFCYPEGQVSKESRSFLHKHGISYALGVGKYTLPKGNSKLTAILSRTPIFEAATFTPDLFTCHLWDARSMGVVF